MSPVAMAVALTLISLSTKSKAADQTWDGGSGSGSAWLTGTNWVGDPADANVPGSKTVTANIDIASFGATGSAATIGINMSFSGNTFYLGAINLTTGSRNIGDSSSTAGTLKLDGATVNSVANVILRNTNSGTLTVLGTSTGTMGLALGNTTDNVVSIDGAGGIAVSSIISGAAKHLTLGGVGTGILTLSAANTYSGGTTVAAGNLRVTNTSGSATGTLGVTVANNTGVATLSGTGSISGLVTTATTGANVAHIAAGVNNAASNFGGAGTLNLGGGLTMTGMDTNVDFDLSSTTGGGNDLVTLSNSTLTLGSAFTVNYNLLTPGVLTTSGNYTLFSGASNLLSLTGITITSSGLGAYTPTYSVSGGALLVSFSNVSAPTPNYFDTNGSAAGIGINGASAVWDTTTTNWNPVSAGDGTAKVFDPAQTVYFGASGGGAAGLVAVDAGGVSANLGVEFDVTGYTLGGGAITLGGATPTVTVPTAVHTATINSTVSGISGLTKAGNGTLILGGANSFTGTVNINGGTLSVGSDGNLGAAANVLSFGGGKLVTTAALAAARAMTISTGGGTFDTNGFDSSTSGITTINDAFNKTGAGDLSLNGFVNFGGVAALTVSGGSLTLNPPIGNFGTSVTMVGGAALSGNLIVKSAIRLNLNGAYTGSGQIQTQATGTSLATSGGTVTIANNIVLNSLNLANAFVTNLGPVSSGNITVSGVISGSSDLNIAGGDAGTFRGGGSGTLTLNQQNTYTGATTINLTGTSAVKLGVSNALPPGTALSFGTNSSASGSILDLNGHDQTVDSLASGGIGVASNYKITNKGGVDSTFTVNGATISANAFGGIISDGIANKIALVKAGSGTLALSGANTYSGGTTLSGGTLNVNADAALGALTGGVAMSNGATLQTGASVTSNRAFTLGTGGGVIDTNGFSMTFDTVGSVSGTTLSKMGAGTLTLAGAQTYALLVTGAGITNVNSPLGTGTSSIHANAATNINVSQTLASLVIADGVEVTFGDGLSFAAVPEKVGAEFTAAVPEPSALGLLAAGVLGLAGRWRRNVSGFKRVYRN